MSEQPQLQDSQLQQPNQQRHAWVGNCHFWRQREADAPEYLGDYLKEYQATAVILATDLDDYKSQLSDYLNHNQCGLMHVPNAELVTDYIRNHGHSETVLQHVEHLASDQASGHKVELYDIRWINEAQMPAEPEQAEEDYLIIEEIEGVEPLDFQMGVHPKKTVPDALYPHLFGQPEPTKEELAAAGEDGDVPMMNTYAILDAAKVTNLTTMLQTSQLEYRCLFKGHAYEELKEVAPYIVQLEEDNAFTRNLFSHDPEKDVPWFMWDKEPGIYIRSRASLEQMQHHFRKFTKVQDENGKWFYFRFWESGDLVALMSVCSRDEVRSFYKYLERVITTETQVHDVLSWHSSCYMEKN